MDTIIINGMDREAQWDGNGIFIMGLGTYYPTKEEANANYSDPTGNGVNHKYLKLKYEGRTYYQLTETNLWD